jgi:putative transposase
MREDNLLAIQPQAFVVTTDVQHGLEVYLKSRPSPDSDQNQFWVADITYIRLKGEFVYLRSCLMRIPVIQA